MRNNSTLVILLLTSAPAGLSLNDSARAGSVKAKTNREYNDQLFNGSDLTNRVFYPRDASVDPAEIFSVREGKEIEFRNGYLTKLQK
jgi:hypothetical protein